MDKFWRIRNNGFGLPSAMGVQFANPNSLVCCVTGEASIQMYIQELSTCLQCGLPIKIINLNNRYGCIKTARVFL